MIVRRLLLKNFRCFRDLDLTDLPEGLTGIIGRNGSGKSTLLEAIGWALYGTDALATRTKKDGVKTQGADPSDSCEVVLEFTMGGDSYKIERRLRGKSADPHAVVYKNGNAQAEAERERGVNTYISKLFGMDRATFFASVFAQQKELDKLTSETPGERQRIIRRLLRLDLIEIALKEIRQDKSRKEDEVRTLQGVVLEDVSLVQAGIEALKEQKKILIGQEKDEENELESLKKSLEAARVQKHRVEEKHAVDLKLEKAITGLESEIRSSWERKQQCEAELKGLETGKNELEKLEPQETEYLRAQEELEKLRSASVLCEKKRSLEKNIKDHEKALERVLKGRQESIERLKLYEGLNEEKKKLQSELKSRQVRRARLSEEMVTLKTRVDSSKEEISKLEEKKGGIETLGPKSKCPECLQDLGGNYKSILEHFDGEIRKHRGNIEMAAGKIKELAVDVKTEEKHVQETEDQLENVAEKVNIRTSLETKLRSEEKGIKDLSRSIEEEKTEVAGIGNIQFSEEQYEALKKKNKELSQVHERIMAIKARTERIPDVLREIKELREKLGRFGAEKTAREKERHDLEFKEEDLARLGKECEASREGVHRQDLKVSDTKHRIERTQDEVARQESSLKQQEELREKLDLARVEAGNLAVLDDVMDRFRQDLGSRIRPMLIAHTSQLLARTTAGKYALIDLDEDYNIFVFDGSERFKVERFSGGEQDLISLCLRIAISRVISEQNGGCGINFIVLDEIFGSQDEGRRESILKVLNDLSGQFQQIFLITHHEDLKDEMQHVLAVEEAEDGVSSASFV